MASTYSDKQIRMDCLALALSNRYLSESTNPVTVTTKDIIDTASKFEAFVKGDE